MSKTSDAVFALVSPIAEQMGLEVVEVEYTKKFDGMNLTVFIDKVGGVTINDCEKLHRAIDKPLDDLDPIEGSYTLNVSSLGIDRPLKTPRDFTRNLNKKIYVKLYQPLENQKQFVGTLVRFDEKTFVIAEQKGNLRTFEISKTAHIEPVIEF